MGFFDGLSDRVTALFIDDDSVQTAHQVAVSQQRELDRQYDDGVIGEDRYDELSDAVDEGGSYLEDARDELSNSSLAPDFSLPSLNIVPTWVKIAAAVAVVALIYWWFKSQKRGLKSSFKFGKSLLPSLLKH